MFKYAKSKMCKLHSTTVMSKDLNLDVLPVSYILLTIITPLSWSPLLYSSLREKSGGYRSRTDDPLRARQVL